MSGWERLLVVQERQAPFRTFSLDIFVHTNGGDDFAVEVFEKLGYSAWIEGGPRADG